VSGDLSLMQFPIPMIQITIRLLMTGMHAMRGMIDALMRVLRLMIGSVPLGVELEARAKRILGAEMRLRPHTAIVWKVATMF